jgi:pimeloyl-ACP methyl ester carboxylesterase
VADGTVSRRGARRARPRAFFADRFGGRLAGQAWASGLERREGGWWPRFDPEVMARMLRAAIAQPSWDEWEHIACPTLVIRAGAVDEGIKGRGVQVVELEGARHDVHLDRPDEWREALTGFLDSLAGGSGPRRCWPR